MKIEIGKTYSNRTRDYLLPCLAAHGNDFVNRYSGVFKLAVGIHDSLLDGSPKSATKNLYILCDSQCYPGNFNSFLNWIRFESYYVTDYTIDAELKNSRRHMIVLTIPKQYHHAYDMFRAGMYSEMYTEEDIKTLFSSDAKKEVRLILNRDASMRKQFCKKVNEEFKNSNVPDDFKDCELDFPISVHPETEIFNYWLNNRKQ